MPHTLPRALAFAGLAGSLFLSAACSGGSDSSPTTTTSAGSGAVHVLLDTAAGSDAFVQGQVVAVTLEPTTGGSTPNLLDAPVEFTLTDPLGSAAGLVLREVASGSFAAVRLVIAPGSTSATYPNGARYPVTMPAELRITFDEPLAHDASGESWVVAGHYGAAPPAGATAAFSWQPMLRAFADEVGVARSSLDVVLVESGGLTVTDAAQREGRLWLTFEASSAFYDAAGNRYPDAAAFVAATTTGTQVDCKGRLSRTGTLRLDEIRQAPVTGNTRARLIGRITQIDVGAEVFWMDVFAEARRGESQTFLPLPSRARVDAANAELERPNDRYLAFNELQVGNLAKVEWHSRQPNQNGIEDVVAREVEVAPASGVGMRPEWQGRVDAVDLTLRTITVVRRDRPLVVNGQVQSSIVVHVPTGLAIERRADRGGGRSMIGLDGVLPGQDRIWIRGRVTAASEVEANRLRVRVD
ncbi:MAG: hypothetical protein NXI31_07065 [bacterium]|nr:hypothetical protein [bacterium]